MAVGGTGSLQSSQSPRTRLRTRDAPLRASSSQTYSGRREKRPLPSRPLWPTYGSGRAPSPSSSPGTCRQLSRLQEQQRDVDGDEEISTWLGSQYMQYLECSDAKSISITSSITHGTKVLFSSLERIRVTVWGMLVSCHVSALFPCQKGHISLKRQESMCLALLQGEDSNTFQGGFYVPRN